MTSPIPIEDLWNAPRLERPANRLAYDDFIEPSKDVFEPCFFRALPLEEGNAVRLHSMTRQCIKALGILSISNDPIGTDCPIILCRLDGPIAIELHLKYLAWEIDAPAQVGLQRLGITQGIVCGLHDVSICSIDVLIWLIRPQQLDDTVDNLSDFLNFLTQIDTLLNSQVSPRYGLILSYCLCSTADIIRVAHSRDLPPHKICTDECGRERENPSDQSLISIEPKLKAAGCFISFHRLGKFWIPADVYKSNLESSGGQDEQRGTYPWSPATQLALAHKAFQHARSSRSLIMNVAARRSVRIAPSIEAAE